MHAHCAYLTISISLIPLLLCAYICACLLFLIFYQPFSVCVVCVSVSLSLSLYCNFRNCALFSKAVHRLQFSRTTQFSRIATHKLAPGWSACVDLRVLQLHHQTGSKCILRMYVWIIINKIYPFARQCIDSYESIRCVDGYAIAATIVHASNEWRFFSLFLSLSVWMDACSASVCKWVCVRAISRVYTNTLQMMCVSKCVKQYQIMLPAVAAWKRQYSSIIIQIICARRALISKLHAWFFFFSSLARCHELAWQ